MTGDVSVGAVLSAEAAREVVAALDQLDRMAAPRGMRLSGRLAEIRRELSTCASRAGAPVGASAETVAAQQVADWTPSVVDTTTAAGHLGITADGVRWLARTGRLAATRTGGRWWIEVAALHDRARQGVRHAESVGTVHHR